MTGEFEEVVLAQWRDPGLLWGGGGLTNRTINIGNKPEGDSSENFLNRF